MFGYYYDEQSGGLILDETQSRAVTLRSARPVFAEELDVYGFNRYFEYDSTERLPYMWAELGSYYYRGVKVARVRGGSFDEKPELEVVDSLFAERKLTPIDVEAMNEANSQTLAWLRDISLERIEEFIAKWRDKVVCFHASYSGGKDSDVMVDLLSQSSIASSVAVIFGDTGMEAKETYFHVAERKTRCRKEGMKFYIARSPLNPIDSWKYFGAPSRRVRWCCNVHKSTPVGLKVRELAGSGKTAAFVGVRAEESPRRREYEMESDEVKVKGQVAFYPILDWMESEVWAYMFWRNVLVNPLYRFGFARVGCGVCCETGGRGDYLKSEFQKEQMETYRDIIISQDVTKTEADPESYWRTCGWKQRMNGYYMNGVERLVKFDKTDTHNLFYGRRFKSNLGEWRKILGGGENRQNGFDVQYYGRTKRVDVIPDGDWTLFKVAFDGGDKKHRQFLSDFKKVLCRAVYCIGCQTCQLNCKRDAITFDENGVHVDAAKCVHCRECLNLPGVGSYGCWGGKSLHIPLSKSDEDRARDIERRKENLLNKAKGN